MKQGIFPRRVLMDGMRPITLIFDTDDFDENFRIAEHISSMMRILGIESEERQKDDTDYMRQVQEDHTFG